MKKTAIFTAFAVAGLWFWLHEPEAAWQKRPAPADPVQTTEGLPPAWTYDGDYTITPLARYAVTAVVLSRSRYRNDRAAELAPLDLALGWGPMSDAKVINALNISQSGRWYEYTWRDAPLPGAVMAANSANTHCIPATPEIRQQLLSVRRHDLVTLEGFLVAVNGPDNYTWRSSLSRTDTGGGACEIFWITRLDCAPVP